MEKMVSFVIKIILKFHNRKIKFHKNFFPIEVLISYRILFNYMWYILKKKKRTKSFFNTDFVSIKFSISQKHASSIIKTIFGIWKSDYKKGFTFISFYSYTVCSTKKMKYYRNTSPFRFSFVFWNTLYIYHFVFKTSVSYPNSIHVSSNMNSFFFFHFLAVAQ